MESGADPDDDGNPDVWELFRHYDKLYFRGVLVEAGFSVEWSHPRMKTISSFGSCSFGESNTITLYEPILKYRTNADLKNALLHLMIHAFLSVKHGAKCIWGHGPAFRDWMDALNTCSIEDRLRPSCGYCITTTHDFSLEKCGSIHGFLWKCESCGVTLLRAKKLGPPSDSCCIENVSQDATCGNILCNWHNHKLDCGGTYVVTKLPETPGQQMVPEGRRGFLTEMSEMLKLQGATQQSDSDEVQENITVAKLKAECKLLSQVGGRNTRSPGSSSLKKASKSNMPEDFQKAIVLPATPQKKLNLKQELVASEKHEPISMVSWNNEKSTIVPSAAPPSILEKKQTSVASEKHELISLGSGNNAKLLRSNTSMKADKWHGPEHVQKSSVRPSASQKKPKLEQDMGASEKYGVFSPGCYNTTEPPGSSTSRKADKRHTPEGVEKSIVPVAAPQKKLKLEPDLIALQQNKINSSTKAEKRHSPGDFRRTFCQPAVSQSKLKQSNRVALERQEIRSVAPKKQKARSVAPERKMTRSVALGKKQEYACISLWANIYESECSSGSAEPLVNKRTERRKREGERSVQITYSRSRKRSASGISSIKAQPAEEEVPSQLPKPPPKSQCLEFILSDTADEVVTQVPRDQSKAPAPRMAIVVVPRADKVMTQAPRDQSQLPDHSMDIDIPLANLLMTQAHGDLSVPSRHMDIDAVPSADKVMTRAPVCLPISHSYQP